MKTDTSTNIVPALLTEREACRYLGVSRAWLANARCNGVRKGHAVPPQHVRCGKMIRFRRVDLDAWIEAHLVRPFDPSEC